MTRRTLREHCFKLLFCTDFYPPEEAGEAAADTAAPAAAELTLRRDDAAAGAAPIQLIEVTPSSRAEADGGERNALDDGSEAECAPAAVTIRAADLSGSATVHNAAGVAVDFDAFEIAGIDGGRSF